MMRFLKLLHGKERGYTFFLSALIILVFASISIVPVLDFMGTGINTTRKTSSSTQEIYAAEAGVYDSIWRIIVIMPGVPKWTDDPPLQYSIGGDVNGKAVDVTLAKIDAETYRIYSTASDPNSSHQRSIVSDVVIGNVGGLDLSAFSTFAMTSGGSISTKSSNIIDGDVWIENSDNYSGVSPTGDMVIAPITGWPTLSLLETYFSLLVNTSNPYSGSIITISNPEQSGPLYAQGASNGNYTITGTGNLTGTIYIDGNVDFDNNANVCLDGHTIFVTGSISTSPQTLIAGPGSIIAIGDISFSPQVTPSFLFIMSASGGVTFQPQGDFIGAVSANTTINLQPNCSITWQDPGIGTLDLPGLYNHIQNIETWNIQ